MARAVADSWSRRRLFGACGCAPGRVLGQRREEPQAVGVGAGEVLLADVTGVGKHGMQPGLDPGLGQLLAAGVQQAVQKGAVDRVPGQHHADDHWFAVTTIWPLYPAM